MLNHKSVFILLFALLFFTTVKATTWDEPWQDEIIKKADYFVLAKVTGSDAKSVSISILKQFGGKPLTGNIKITGFSLLHLCSYSASEPASFEFKHTDSCYFFIQKDNKDRYCIATPTSGFAPMHNNKVAATYRHSYHQALIDRTTYENTMIAIFNHYHGLAYDRTYISTFVNKYLSLKPAGLDADSRELFFNQHAALECIYHLNLQNFERKILPFLRDKENFHAQVSAARALGGYNNNESKQLLLKTISDTATNNFVKVICLWTLRGYKPKELKPQLIKLEKTASTEENGFGGDIMDPRVCTHFPTVKGAFDELLAEIK